MAENTSKQKTVGKYTQKTMFVKNEAVTNASITRNVKKLTYNDGFNTMIKETMASEKCAKNSFPIEQESISFFNNKNSEPKFEYNSGLDNFKNLNALTESTQTIAKARKTELELNNKSGLDMASNEAVGITRANEFTVQNASNDLPFKEKTLSSKNTKKSNSKLTINSEKNSMLNETLSTASSTTMTSKSSSHHLQKSKLKNAYLKPLQHITIVEPMNVSSSTMSASRNKVVNLQKKPVCNKEKNSTSKFTNAAKVTLNATNKATPILSEALPMNIRGGGDFVVNNTSINKVPKLKLNNSEAIIVLLCEKNSHPFETRTIPLIPNTQCIVGRLSSKYQPNESNGIFDCKVLSRNQAVFWYDNNDRKFWLKDTQSSNGTFLNESKLNETAAELHSGDRIQFGVNVYENLTTEVNTCIMASIQLYLPKLKNIVEIKGTTEAKAQNSELSTDVTKNEPKLHETPKIMPTANLNDEAVSDTTAVEKETLQRIHIYIRDANHNDKAIKFQIHNMESLLAALRACSTESWEDLIKEDDYLHRIYLLKKKLQILSADMSETELKQEIQSLENEKTIFYRTTKATLRRVNLERKEILQKVENMQLQNKSSKIECDTLRAEINAKDQTLNDLDCSLRHVKMDFEEYCKEMEFKATEQKVKSEMRINELNESMAEREKELESLKVKLLNLMQEKPKVIKKIAELTDLNEVQHENYEHNDDVEQSTEFGLDLIQQWVQFIGKLETLKGNFATFESFECFETKHNSIEEHTIKNLIKTTIKDLEEAYLETFIQFKQIQIIINSTNSHVDEKPTLPIHADNCEKHELSNCIDFSEQFKDISYYEAQINELEAQLCEQALNTEHLQEMLKIDCDNVKQKCIELQKQHDILLLKEETSKSSPPTIAKPITKSSILKKQKVSVTDACINTDESCIIDSEVQFEEQQRNFIEIIRRETKNLDEIEKELDACKTNYPKKQKEHTILQSSLKRMEQDQQQLIRHNKRKFIQIAFPIFIGLIGMAIYLVLAYNGSLQ